jgi:folate-binding protein YgfZ
MVKRFYPLEQQTIILASGQDCDKYLNNRLSNNLKSLSTLQSYQFSCALSVQGKTEALFTVYKRHNSEYLLLCAGEDRQSIISALSRYKVTEKVVIEDISDQHNCYHITPLLDSKNVVEELKVEHTDLLCVFAVNRTGEIGIDLILPKTVLSVSEIFIKHGFSEQTPKQLEIARIKAQIPAFPQEINPHFLLQESGLSQAYSTRKGCYVGQEVTQKIDSFAKLPYRLLAFQIFNPSNILKIGEPIFLNSDYSNQIGQIITLVDEGVVCCGFARVKSSIEPSSEIFCAAGKLKLLPIRDFTSEEHLCLIDS